MNYIVYTDASANTKEKIVGCSFVIIADGYFITKFFKKIKNMTNPTQAETICVGLAAEHILNNINIESKDTITFYTDCLSTIEFLDLYTANMQMHVRGNKQVTDAVNHYRELYLQFNVSIAKVRGHQDKMNINKYVDKLAKFAIRR